MLCWCGLMCCRLATISAGFSFCLPCWAWLRGHCRFSNGKAREETTIYSLLWFSGRQVYLLLLQRDDRSQVYRSTAAGPGNAIFHWSRDGQAGICLTALLYLTLPYDRGRCCSPMLCWWFYGVPSICLTFLWNAMLWCCADVFWFANISAGFSFWLALLNSACLGFCSRFSNGKASSQTSL